MLPRARKCSWLCRATVVERLTNWSARLLVQAARPTTNPRITASCMRTATRISTGTFGKSSLWNRVRYVRALGQHLDSDGAAHRLCSVEVLYENDFVVLFVIDKLV